MKFTVQQSSYCLPSEHLFPRLLLKLKTKKALLGVAYGSSLLGEEQACQANFNVCSRKVSELSSTLYIAMFFLDSLVIFVSYFFHFELKKI